MARLSTILLSLALTGCLSLVGYDQLDHRGGSYSLGRFADDSGQITVWVIILGGERYNCYLGGTENDPSCTAIVDQFLAGELGPPAGPSDDVSGDGGFSGGYDGAGGGL